MAVGSETTFDLATGEPDEEFWRGLDRGVVQVTRCADCEAWIWPTRPSCPRCSSDELIWTSVEPRGHVYSWTRVWYPFVPERADDLPYVVVVVELDSAPGVRILGVYDGTDVDLRIGFPLEGAIVAPAAATFGLSSLRWSPADTDRR